MAVPWYVLCAMFLIKMAFWQGFLGLKKNTGGFCLDCKNLEKVIGEESLVILWSQEHLLK